MGMAAGQARLLSITARMSDNELRAQIINNDKMRLATESSQVSETYVQALNEAELMFANYDANNNASFQQLTFNSLTAYNPYNNQYALTNASGNILISEKDAKNYESAGGDMEKFLKCYGLEKTTTYFDKDNLNLDANGNVQFINPEILDTDGNYIPQSTGLTPEELKLAYLGLDTYKNLGGNLNSINLNGATGVVPQGYETTLNGVKYNDYMRYLDKYNQKYAEFQGSISAIMEKELDKIVKKYTNYDTLNKLKEALSQLNEDKHKNDISNIMTNLQKVISGSAFSSTATSSAGSNTVGSANNTTSYALADSDVENYFKTLWNRLNGNKGSNINYDLFTDNPIDPTVGGSVKEDNFELVYTSDGTNPTLSAIKIYDDDGTTLKEEISIGSNAYSTNSASPITVTIGGTQTKYLFSTSYDSANKIYTLNVTEVGANTIENMKSVTNNVIKSLKNALGNVWDPEKSTFTSQEPAETYYKDYVEAGR